MILADTGAIVALLDADDRHHADLRELFESDPGAWVIPWAILPEVDYLLSKHVSQETQQDFLADVVDGAFAVEWGERRDLHRADELTRRYAGLRLGLVDSVVMAMAERLRVEAIATLDLRHFGAVTLAIRPKLLPRDSR